MNITVLVINLEQIFPKQVPIDYVYCISIVFSHKISKVKF